MLKDLSKRGLICRFEGGVCPQFKEFLGWTDKYWNRSSISSIFFCSRGFICILFNEDGIREIIFDRHYTWKQRILCKDEGGHSSCTTKRRVLYTKFWHPKFDPITENFDILTVLVRLPNLPIPLRQLSALQGIANSLGKFVRCAKPEA